MLKIESRVQISSLSSVRDIELTPVTIISECDTNADANTTAMETAVKIGKEKDFAYILEKDIAIEPNSEYVMNENDHFWENNDVKKFDINRWIVNGNKFRNCIHSFPFGYGTRECIGKTLVLKEMYLLFANLLINYQFRLVDDNVEIEFESKIPPRTVKNPIDLRVKMRI